MSDVQFATLETQRYGFNPSKDLCDTYIVRYMSGLYRSIFYSERGMREFKNLTKINADFLLYTTIFLIVDRKTNVIYNLDWCYL